MNKSTVTLVSDTVLATKEVFDKLKEMLPKDKYPINRLAEACRIMEDFENKLTPETREGGVTAKYRVSTLNREFALLGKLFHVTYSSIDDGQKIQAVITINHSACEELAAVINTLTC